MSENSLGMSGNEYLSPSLDSMRWRASTVPLALRARGRVITRTDPGLIPATPDAGLGGCGPEVASRNFPTPSDRSTPSGNVQSRRPRAAREPLAGRRRPTWWTR
eukprot:5135891-Prymnesium_polylepis.1